jgi:LuxR family maltose regulon positive regulatory protein
MNASVPMLHLGSTLRIRGDTERSVEYLRGALERSRGGVERIVEINSMSQLSAALWDLGQYEQAELYARQAIACETEYGLLRLAMAGAARTTLADILRQRGELDEARELTRAAFEIIVTSGDGEDVVAQMWALHTLALIEATRGAADDAVAAMDEALDRAERHIRSDRRKRAVEGLRAHIFLLLGDPARAAEWDPQFFLADPPVHPYLAERATLCAAWILAEQGRLAQAGQALTRLIELLESAGRRPRQAEAQLLLAAVRALEGRSDEAVEHAVAGAGWALANRAWRTLLDTHPAVAQLLPAVRARWTAAGGAWPAYLDARAASAARPSQPDQAALAEPLTERELEVLALLGAGITNQELADRLFISVGTVKRHTHNIYSKLGVHSRTQAIIRSQALGLLETG